MGKQAHTLIAEHLLMDSAEVYEYRYHYGLTRRPIYAIGEQYYTTGRTMPTDFSNRLRWRRVAGMGSTYVWEGSEG